MKYRKMLGETIYTLRKEKGLSQAELGKLVGVSNKAVSKWETDEANPEIGVLPLLAEALGVTADELLNNIKIEKKDFSIKEVKVFGFKGSQIKTNEKYEFTSDKTTKKGVPYLHINIGTALAAMNTKARGLIAIGNNAKGLIAIGLVSMGVIGIGIISLGVISIAVAALGLLALGSLAVGGMALGGAAIGIIAFGGVAIGYISYGGVSIGYYAYSGITGISIGKHTKLLNIMSLRKGGFGL